MKEKFKIILFTSLFLIFLYPFSISLSNEDGASANYTFILFPIFLLIKNFKIILPSKFWLNILFFFTLIFFIALIYQYELYIFFIRRFTSFLIFMFIFSYLFLDINDNIVKSFKISIIIISIYFSLITLYKYITLGGIDLGYAAKGAVGSQRFGFVYVMAIWIIFFFKTKNIYHKAFKFIILFIIIIGLFLTFSRSGIIALFLSFLIYFFISLKKWLNKPNLNGLFIGFVLIFTILFLVLVINFYFPLFFDFFNVKLFSLLQSNNSVNFDLEDSESSEGYRLFVMKKVLNFLINNPITGSGYLGVWILFDDKSGSAHGQFIDVIFRTGIFGFIIYLYILFLILRKLYYLESGLFWGTLAVLIYGFFHETFKTSHGAFIFAFLVGYTANYRNKNNELYK